MLRAAARRAYWGTQAWQDQALAAKRNASSTQAAPISFATLQSLYSFRPGIAYVLDALYLAPTARSPARRTMRSCRGAAFATKDAGLAPLPASRAATTGLLLAGLVGVLVGGSLVLGAMPVCLSYSKGADLARAAAPYVAVRAMALPAALIASVAQAACLGLRDATTPGLSVAIAAALNLMGDFVLVPRQGL